jgi:hypothetical protein
LETVPDTRVGTSSIAKFLQEWIVRGLGVRQSLIPVLEDVNVNAVISALRLIMENNVLQRLVSNPALRLTLAGKLRIRLLARGYTPEQLDPLFCEARAKCFLSTPKELNPHFCEARKCFPDISTKLDTNGINPIYLHVNFHPADPSARIIQRLARRYLLSPQGDLPIHALRNYQGFEFGVNRIIVAYHRPRNLKNYLAPRRLNPLGTSVSSIVEAFHATTKT